MNKHTAHAILFAGFLAICPSWALAGDKNLTCVQSHLSVLGYKPGPADGAMGRRTRSAAIRFAATRSLGLPVLSVNTSRQWCETLTKLSARMPKRSMAPKNDAVFWTPPKSRDNCDGFYSWGLSFELAVTLKRQPYPNDHGVNFAHYLGMGLGKTMAGTEVEKFKKYMIDAATAKTFTKVSFRSRWSPIYVQSNILRLIAMYVTYMEGAGQMTAAERQILINWGTPMVAGQKRRKQNGSADSRAASGVALMSWGSVTGDSQLIKTGYGNWKEALPYVIKSIGRLRRHPSHRNVPIRSLSLEDEYNLTLAHVIEGAAILENLGVDAFSIKHRGRTIHDAVNWWAGKIAKRPKRFDGFRRANHNWHLAWIPIYLSKYPNRPVADILRPIAKQVSRGQRPMFEGVSLGGPTDCFWGYQAASS